MVVRIVGVSMGIAHCTDWRLWYSRQPLVECLGHNISPTIHHVFQFHLMVTYSIFVDIAVQRQKAESAYL